MGLSRGGLASHPDDARTRPRLLPISNVLYDLSMPPAPASRERVFHAIADPTRRAILDLLRDSERSVGELAKPFAISQPAVSQHLAVLRRAGLVRVRQAGRRRVYRMVVPPIERVFDWAAQYVRQRAAPEWGAVAVRPLGRLLEFRGQARQACAILRARAVCCFVSDLAAALEFYRDKLGFEVRTDEATESGARRVEVAPPDAQTAIALVSRSDGAPDGAGPPVVFACRDLKAARRELSTRGIRIPERPAREPGLGMVLRMLDPDGNPLLLVEEP